MKLLIEKMHYVLYLYGRNCSSILHPLITIINMYNFVLQKLLRIISCPNIQYLSKFNRRKLIIEIRPDYKKLLSYVVMYVKTNLILLRMFFDNFSDEFRRLEKQCNLSVIFPYFRPNCISLGDIKKQNIFCIESNFMHFIPIFCS